MRTITRLAHVSDGSAMGYPWRFWRWSGWFSLLFLMSMGCVGKRETRKISGHEEQIDSSPASGNDERIDSSTAVHLAIDAIYKETPREEQYPLGSWNLPMILLGFA
jgi:hypothetical protein